MTLVKRLTLISLLSLLSLSACQPAAPTASRKEKIIRFALNHPVAAWRIGMKKNDADNLTSNAVRFSLALGLDDTVNPDGRGTQVNAIRHTLWQASITSIFSSKLAKLAGDAYEKNNTPPSEEQTEFNKLYNADESTDLRNNAIGRAIGEQHPHTPTNELLKLILQQYHQQGLWQIFPVERDGKTVYQIRQTRLSDEDYQKAMEKLAGLNAIGYPK